MSFLGDMTGRPPVHPFLSLLGRLLARFVCRVHLHHAAPLPATGCLLVSNASSWEDALFLQAASPRPIRFVLPGGVPPDRRIAPVLHTLGGTYLKCDSTANTLSAALQAGDIVCMLSSSASVESSLIGTAIRVATECGAPSIPVWSGTANNPLPRNNKRKLGTSGDRHAHSSTQRVSNRSIVIGAPLQHAEPAPLQIRTQLLDLAERAYAMQPELRGHLGRAALRGLSQRRSRIAVEDGMDGSRLSRGMLLSAALALATQLRKRCPDPRVAIVLPPGRGAAIANVAVVLAGKVPVNLNFTAGRASLEAAIRIADLRWGITAGAFQAKLTGFPWPENVLLLEETLPTLKARMLLWRALIAWLPAGWIAAHLRLPKTGDAGEAVLLFTSGSSGDPKGVVLSHRNLLGNVSQFASMLGMRRDDSILACLPVFHSFGSTVNLWFPILEGLKMVTYPSPLDISKNAELVERFGVKLLCSTPTFLRGYLRKADPRQLASVELLVTGAEKLPADLADAFEARFGIEVLQGYGLTETSPVVSVNLPNRAPSEPQRPATNRRGSVGKLAPGISARIRDPETGADLPLESTGMLWLKGINIFEGYLHDPERTRLVLQDRWLWTGDLARFDADGFLYIEGRLARFSKVGGEMVPHETVEAAIRKAADLSGEELTIAVAGVPDEAKGEALVLLSSRALDFPALRAQLSAQGLPNLWIPRRVVRCEAIPQLASGKLDLRGIQQLALNANE